MMFTRDCPQCGEKLTYKRKNALTLAIKNGRPCTSCSTKNRFKRGIKESTRKKLSENMSKNRRNGTTVPNKPFAGHKHTMATRKHLSKKLREIRGLPEEPTKFCNKMLITWSNDVRKRDEYVCQHCNHDFYPHECDAHHIMPKAKFPQYAYDLDNGITLCKECHRYEHKHYGRS